MPIRIIGHDKRQGTIDIQCPHCTKPERLGDAPLGDVEDGKDLVAVQCRHCDQAFDAPSGDLFMEGILVVAGPIHGAYLLTFTPSWGTGDVPKRDFVNMAALDAFLGELSVDVVERHRAMADLSTQGVATVGLFTLPFEQLKQARLV